MTYNERQVLIKKIKKMWGWKSVYKQDKPSREDDLLATELFISKFDEFTPREFAYLHNIYFYSHNYTHPPIRNIQAHIYEKRKKNKLI